MNKIILLVVAVTLMANTINAQDNIPDSRDMLHFGIKAGANFSNVYDSKDQQFNTDYKFGFAGGAYVAIPLGRFIGIQPEILYSQKGYKTQGTFLTIPYKFTHTTSYIDIPIFLALKFSENVTVLAGPQYSFLISQKDVFTSGNLNVDQEQQFRNDKSVFCIAGGIDLNLNILVLSARAGYDLQNNNGDGTSTNPRYKNVWYQATVGFRF